MKKLCAISCLFFISGAQVLAASTKIYDENGFRLGICTKNGEIYEAFDLDGKPITKDALNNPVPSKILYFYDISGNLIRFSNEKRTIAPVNIEYNNKLYKGPIYSRRELTF